MKHKIFAAVISVVAFASPRVQAQEFTFATLAGSPGIAAHVDGIRNAARFLSPIGVAVDPSGNIYVTDGWGNNIRKVTPAGVVTTWAGSGYIGSADGTGNGALFNSPQGISFDSSGNAYVSDSGNNTIRKVTPAGVVTTLAGSAVTSGNSDGTGSAATFNLPRGITVDADGNLLVADCFNSLIRKVTPAGVVTTFAGTPYVQGSNVDNSGSSDGTGTAAKFHFPSGIARDSTGNIYVTDTDNHTIRKISPAGVVTTLAGSPGQTGSTDGTGTAARFYQPNGIAVDATNNVYVADTGNQTIRQISPAGVVTTVGGLAGQSGSADGIGTAARFYGPAGLAINAAGYLYVGDAFNNFLLRVGAPAGADTLPVITSQPLNQTNMAGQNAVFTLTVIGTPTPTYQWQRSIDGGTTWNNLTNNATYGGVTTASLTVTRVTLAMQGDKFQCVATNVTGATVSNAVILKIGPAYSFVTLAGSDGQNGSTDGTGTAARFDMPNGRPSGVAVDAGGSIFVADMGNHAIRKVTPAGVVTTFAGSMGQSGSTDGIGSNARFNSPAGLAFDATGNLFVTELSNNTIRKITSDGMVSTFAGLAGTYGYSDGTGTAARFYGPSGIAIDRLGNAYVVDNVNSVIRKITPAGLVTTLAGGSSDYQYSDGSGNASGNNAHFVDPVSIAVDSAFNLYVVQLGVIRKITSTGVVTTLAGNGNGGNIDGPGTLARFTFPEGIAVDAAGTAYVTSSFDRTIRMITQSGIVSTLAGTAGIAGTADGVGTNAQFSQPMGIAVDSTGKLYVTDAGNQTIRVGTLIGGATGPVLNEQPTDQMVVAGHPAVFSIAATALPVPSYQWQISNSEGVSWGNLASDATFAGVNSAGLTVNSPSVSLNGARFRCVVTNTQGAGISDPAISTVTAPVGDLDVTTWAGAGGYFGSIDGAAANARFHSPSGVAVDQVGNAYVADTENHIIRKITVQGIVSTLAGMAGSYGSADGIGTAARFYKPTGIAVDTSGNVYVADSYNQTIRKITPVGVATTLAGSPLLWGADDGTGANARFFYPSALVVDAAGIVYVADRQNQMIRRVTPDGAVTTIAGVMWQTGTTDGIGTAARFYDPSGITIDSSGNLYVADSSSGHIRKITQAGVVTTVVGSGLYRPSGLCRDGTGNFYVIDSSGQVIRRVDSTGTIVNLAGSLQSPGAYDGLGNSAQFNTPIGIAMDSLGNLYIADSGNHAVRKGVLVITTPNIATPPMSQRVTAGNSVTFSASAGGNPIPTYQWQKNGINIDGATSSSYTIANVVLGDAGSYAVIASNSSGSVTSNGATLEVGIPPAGFDVAGYFSRNPSLGTYFGSNTYAAWIYYHDYGIYQGEVFDDLFRVDEYLTLYPELFTIFGDDLGAALDHWLSTGRIEGKLGRIPGEFSADGYFTRNPDVAIAVGNDPLLAWGHYWLYGIYEGRAYDDELRVFEYLAINADLTAAFVNDWRQAALHWMRYGRTEGRLGRLPLTFSVAEYLNRSPDVAAVWGTNPTTVFLHFWLYGIDENRTYDDLFRPVEYLALNPDLAPALGTDRRLAFKHWVRYGMTEGRPGKHP